MRRDSAPEMNGGRFFRPRLVEGLRTRPTRDVEAQTERFRQVMLPHMDAVYGFARYLTRDPAAAEDLVQEAFLRAFRGFDAWRGGSPKAWLLAIVRHCHIDTVRARHDPLRGAEGIEAIDDCEPLITQAEDLEDRIARQSDAIMVRRTIENLPEPFREALILRELEELSYKEIAEITQVQVGTVMSRLSRARIMLATLLLPRDGEPRKARP